MLLRTWTSQAAWLGRASLQNLKKIRFCCLTSSQSVIFCYDTPTWLNRLYHWKEPKGMIYSLTKLPFDVSTLAMLIISAGPRRATHRCICSGPQNQHSSCLTFFKLFYKWHLPSEDFTDPFRLHPSSISPVCFPCFSLLNLYSIYILYILLVNQVYFFLFPHWEENIKIGKNTVLLIAIS